MVHPVFNSIKTKFLFISIWALITATHIVFFGYYNKLGFIVALTDGLVFNLFFSALSLPVWYIVNNKPDKPGIINLLVNQLTSAIVILMLWIGTSILLMHLIFPGDKDYHQFLITTLPWRVLIGVFFYSITILVYYLSIYYDNLQERVKTEMQLREAIRQAELDLLKSQINPHFLFNSLNSISSLTMTDAGRAQEMIIQLSDYLRYSIAQPLNQITSLQAEMMNINRYLNIEKVRFGDKLIYENMMDEMCLGMKIPAMMLQPLYENAIKHGVYESSGPVMIKTLCQVNNNFLKIAITNNFDPEALVRKGTGTGLRNIRERLKLLYGNDQLLRIDKGESTFTAELMIPQQENIL